jgi:hypothetical protein
VSLSLPYKYNVPWSEDEVVGYIDFEGKSYVYVCIRCRSAGSLRERSRGPWVSYHLGAVALRLVKTVFACLGFHVFRYSEATIRVWV